MTQPLEPIKEQPATDPGHVLDGQTWAAVTAERERLQARRQDPQPQP